MSGYGGPRGRTPGPTRAFTLVEILVVLAILTVLAAITWPVIERSKERARISSCQSNLRQIGTAALMYAQDYDERLGPSIHGEYSDPGVAAWADDLLPYTASYALFECPSEPAKIGANDRGILWRQGMTNRPDGRKYSYGLNDFPLITPYTTRGPAGRKLGAIEDICGTILAAEGDGATPAVLAAGSYALADLEGQLPGTRHTFGGQAAVNAVFCDGHVKWLRVEQTVTGRVNMWTTGIAN